jgi:hypothetical protein
MDIRPNLSAVRRSFPDLRQSNSTARRNCSDVRRNHSGVAKTLKNPCFLAHLHKGGDAGFPLLASETHSPYVDNRPLLTAGKPETWNYKAVFFLGKSEIGLQSDVATATARP